MAGLQVAEWPSPSFGERRGGRRPELIVIHHTAMATAEAALARLADPAAEVSAHYVVAEDGRVWRMVAEEARAWHAGAGTWRGEADVNSRSIGIELANPGPLAGFPPFPEPQVVALEGLIDGIRARWAIPAAGVIAHSDMAPGRKADPGPKFDWRRLATGGRAVWPRQAEDGGGWEGFRAAAEAAGYAAPGGDWEAVLAAFRLRFRPWARGPLGPLDVGTMRGLAALTPGAGATS
jgi:N-acetylmuramoyl-L-alanine amidase